MSSLHSTELPSLESKGCCRYIYMYSLSAATVMYFTNLWAECTCKIVMVSCSCLFVKSALNFSISVTAPLNCFLKNATQFEHFLRSNLSLSDRVVNGIMTSTVDRSRVCANYNNNNIAAQIFAGAKKLHYRLANLSYA